MTLEELKWKQKLLLNEYNTNVKRLNIQYCDANNPYKIGDKFTDQVGTITIEHILYSNGEKPCCVYYGAELKKDGTPRKDNSKRQAWQSNEIK